MLCTYRVTVMVHLSFKTAFYIWFIFCVQTFITSSVLLHVLVIVKISKKKSSLCIGMAQCMNALADKVHKQEVHAHIQI